MDIQTNFEDFKGKRSLDWTAYNKSQTSEKIIFLKLLNELCGIMGDLPHSKGRKPVELSDMIFSCCLKTYLGFSSRRSISDLKMAQNLNYLSKTVHFNTILKYLDDRTITPILKQLIEISALPLKQIETDFAVDATGFSTGRFDRWTTARVYTDSKIRYWKKAHVTYGVLTNIVTSVEITSGSTHDSIMFQEIITRTANNFKVREVSADLGYSSHKNLQIVSELGGIPFIPFKKNTKKNPRGCRIWKSMFEYFYNHKEDFLKHYHKRSQAESGFSMIKRRFGDFTRCKKETAQTNEILCKILCHNICVLIQETYINGIPIDFYKCADVYIAHN